MPPVGKKSKPRRYFHRPLLFFSHEKVPRLVNPSSRCSLSCLPSVSWGEAFLLRGARVSWPCLILCSMSFSPGAQLWGFRPALPAQGRPPLRGPTCRPSQMGVRPGLARAAVVESGGDVLQDARGGNRVRMDGVRNNSVSCSSFRGPWLPPLSLRCQGSSRLLLASMALLPSRWINQILHSSGGIYGHFP